MSSPVISFLGICRFLIYVKERNDVYIKYCDKRKCIRGKQKNSTTKIQEKQKNEESIHNQLVPVQISIHPSNQQNPKNQNPNLRQHPMSQTRTEERHEDCAFLASTICEPSFGELVLDAIDEVFSALEDSCKGAIYACLSELDIQRKEIPHKIEEVSEAIERIFGPSAKLIEIRIIKALHERMPNFEYCPEEADLLFTNYVKRLNVFL